MKSKSHLTLALLLALAGTLVTAAPAPSSPDPVCIVGAGPAGLAAANSLERKGKKVVVFEKQSEVGGKCQAFYENGYYHPLGALLYSNLTYTSTLEIINSVSVPSVEFASTGRGPSYLFDPSSGVTIPRPAVPLNATLKLGLEVARYSLFWTVEFWPLYGNVGYKNPIPAKFAVTTREWLQTNKYEVLDDLFVLGMTAYGYGDPMETPIIYMLQYFTPDIVTFFANVHKGYLIDFHQVFVQYAQKWIKSPINLSTTITRIDRSSSRPQITYQAPSSTSERVQSCSSLILAFPPTLQNLQAANLDLMNDEIALFSSVETTNYYASAVRMNIPDDFTYNALSSAADVPPPAFGEPVAFLRLWDQSNIATAWSWDSLASTQTSDQVKQLLEDTLTKVNKDPRVPGAVGKPVTDEDVVAFKKWDYFPHVSAEQIGQGWYRRFNKQQGSGRTYYASGLNGFETVEFAVRAGRDVVSSFF